MLKKNQPSIKSICVYCGSSAGVNQDYKDAAKKLGHMIADKGRRLVYGGGRMGLMGVVADAALEKDGEVLGIIPSHLSEKETAHQGLTDLYIVETMHERKQLMVENSDAFVILPGGLGTMDEFFEVFTWWQLGLHDKPILVANINDYWSPLVDLVTNIAKEGFCGKNDFDQVIVVDSVIEVIEALDKAPKETNDPNMKWI